MLNECGIRYQIIGDAKTVGNIKDAVHAGYFAAKD